MQTQTTTNIYRNKAHRISKQQQPQDGAIKAVFPTLNSEATALTMDAYRLYIDDYNRSVEEENEEIIKYNASLPHPETLTAFQNDRRLGFLNTNGRFTTKNGKQKVWRRSQKMNAREYNKEVAEWNEVFGCGLEKEKIQSVKPATEQVFRQILFNYSLQLLRHTTALQRFNIEAKTPIKGVVVNARSVVTATRQGITVVPFCTKTIRNHRLRLEEAGVFVDYIFLSAKRGVELVINPAILHIFDLKNRKITTSENQWLTAFDRKKLPHIYYDSYKNTKNKEEIKENVDNNNSPKKVSDKSDECSTLDQSSEKKEFANAHNENNVQEQTLQEHLKQTKSSPVSKSQKWNDSSPKRKEKPKKRAPAKL